MKCEGWPVNAPPAWTHHRKANTRFLQQLSFGFELSVYGLPQTSLGTCIKEMWQYVRVWPISLCLNIIFLVLLHNFLFHAGFSILLGQMKSGVRAVLDLIQLDGLPGFCLFLLVSCHLNFMYLSLFLEMTFLGIIFCAVLVLYAGTDCICSSKMPVLHNFHHFTVLHFVIFCLSLVVVCYVLTVVCHTAVNNFFGLPLKLSSLQLLNKVSWNTLSSNRMISTDRSVSGYILQPGKPFVLALFAFRIHIFMQI